MDVVKGAYFGCEVSRSLVFQKCRRGPKLFVTRPWKHGFGSGSDLKVNLQQCSQERVRTLRYTKCSACLPETGRDEGKRELESERTRERKYERERERECGQTLNNDGLLSVWFNDEDCLAYVRDAIS